MATGATNRPEVDGAPAWPAIFAMALAVAAVMTTELLPISLLTPIAADLPISPGLAGQAITVTALAALVTSLLITSLTHGIDRRRLILTIITLLIAANLLVALASNLVALLIGRVLVGIAHGGLWSMVPATAMRLAPAAQVPRMLSVMFGGVPIAVAAAAPLGSYVGNLVGWRGAFVMAGGIALVTLFAQLLTLPTMPSTLRTGMKTHFRLLRRPSFALGILAVFLGFAGHYSFFTYVRPLVKRLPGVGSTWLPLVFLAYGVANFGGVIFSHGLIARSFSFALTLCSLVLAAVTFTLGAVGLVWTGLVVLVALYGFSYGFLPVGWNTWVTRVCPGEAESGGGLLVATIQLGIATGAAIGGIAYDHGGTSVAFATGGIALVLAALAALTSLWTITSLDAVPTPDLAAVR